jgi:beta-phosphoglucomutase-like phosphatase (HAD superfamily)
MSASIAIQVLPKVETDGEVCRIVDDVIVYIQSTGLVYHASAKRLGATPQEIAVYEDALYAVQTAKEAGYYVVGVYDDSAAKNWLNIEKLADEIVLNWEEAV